MKVPTWAMVIGVTMMVFGGCGVLNNVQKINTPRQLEKGSGMISEISKELDKAIEEQRQIELEKDSLNSESDSTSRQETAERLENLGESMSQIWKFSDYYKKWIVRIGYIGLIVSMFYAIAGVLLIMGKRIAIKISYGAIGLSLAAVIFQIVILSMDEESGMLAGMGNLGAFFMIFVNVILLVVLLASDKSFFYEMENDMV